MDRQWVEIVVRQTREDAVPLSDAEEFIKYEIERTADEGYNRIHINSGPKADTDALVAQALAKCFSDIFRFTHIADGGELFWKYRPRPPRKISLRNRDVEKSSSKRVRACNK